MFPFSQKPLGDICFFKKYIIKKKLRINGFIMAQISSKVLISARYCVSSINHVRNFETCSELMWVRQTRAHHEPKWKIEIANCSGWF